MKTIKHINLLLLIVAIALMGCKEKKTSDDIIVEKTTNNEPKAVEKSGDYNDERSIDWGGSTYTVSVSRQADESLPQIADSEGRKYYDNKVRIKVTRSDGSTFFDKEFTKQYFVSQVGEEYIKSNVLTGIVLDKVENGSLIFVASVGSPDNLSDEYIPMRVALSRMGDITVTRSSELDLE